MSDWLIWLVALVGMGCVVAMLPIDGELRFVPAGRIWTFILRRLKVVAMVTPWGTCYHLGIASPALRRHERVHWEQYRCHGRIWFVVLYLVETFRNGFRNNRFEVEARRAENG